MATIPGSQFGVTASATVNIVETATGTGLPAPVSGDFNLEVFVGALANVPTITPGYQGLAVLTSGGLELDLVSGAYAVTDNGTGADTITALGNYETISGSGTANVTLNLAGTGDVANAVGGNDTIGVLGSYDTVNGAGNDTVSVVGFGNDVNGSASGTNSYTISGNYDTVSTGGNATDTVNVGGFGDQVNTSGADTINITAGASFDTVAAGTQSGTNTATINLSGASTNFTFADAGTHTYADTIVGFSTAAGDTIHLTTDSVSDALAHTTHPTASDTLIHLNDGSTILLKGVANVHGSFFS